MKRFKNDWILFFILAAVAITFGILLIVPGVVKNKGLELVNYIVGALILIYDISYLVPNITRRRMAVVKGFMIAELVIVTLIGLSLIIPQIPIKVTVSQAIGVCIYVRGFVEIVRGYYNLGDQRIAGKKSAYDHAAKYINIALITLGTWVFFCGASYINKERILLCVAIALLVVGVLLLYLAITHLSEERKNAPKKEKKKDKQEENKVITKEESKEEDDEEKKKKPKY